MLVVMLTRPAVDQLFIRNCWYPPGNQLGWKIPWQMEVFSWEHHCINGYKWWIFGSIPHFFLASSRETGSKFYHGLNPYYVWLYHHFYGYMMISPFFGTVYYYWVCLMHRGHFMSFLDYLPMFYAQTRKNDLLDGVSSQTPINHHHQPTTTEIHKIVFLYRNHY